MANSNKFGGFNLPTGSDFGFDKTGSNWGGDFLKLFNPVSYTHLTLPTICSV